MYMYVYVYVYVLNYVSVSQKTQQTIKALFLLVLLCRLSLQNQHSSTEAEDCKELEYRYRLCCYKNQNGRNKKYTKVCYIQ